MKRVIASTILLVVFSQASFGAEKPMNIIFILADDLGWSDTTICGKTSLYKTPNLERLANRGMLFTRAYSASPLCSPTRASILTGQTPARLGLTTPCCHIPGQAVLKAKASSAGRPGSKVVNMVSVNRLDTAFPTLGKQVKKAGYVTGHFGKWHLGMEPYSPLQHGFDVDVPHWPGPGPAGSFVAPWRFPKFKARRPKEHIEDRMAQEAVTWLKSVPKEKPFFMNYWQFSVHAPFDAKQELIDKYRPVIDIKSPQRSATYAAMVHSLDDAIGTLLDTVDKMGIADNTAILFISDNGGNMYNGIPEKTVDGKDYITAPTSNAPLRGGKATMFEGGIRVPCVIVWPGVVKPGTCSDEIIQTTDFYPTIHKLLGIPMPKDHPVDGIDITPALKGGKLNREAIFTYFPHAPPVPDWIPPSIAAHCGDWKLIRMFHEGENRAHAYRLYNLKDDIGEKTDLSSKYPDRVAAMDKLIEKHLKEANVVVPLPNPKFDPSQYKPESIGVQPGGLKVAGKKKTPRKKPKKK